MSIQYWRKRSSKESKSDSIVFKRIIFTCLHCVSFAIINKSLKFWFLIFNSNNYRRNERNEENKTI